MVDRLDDGAIGAALGPLDYKGLYKVGCFYTTSFIKFNIIVNCVPLIFKLGSQAVGKALFRAHVEGQLKVDSTIVPKIF